MVVKSVKSQAKFKKAWGYMGIKYNIFYELDLEQWKKISTATQLTILTFS